MAAMNVYADITAKAEELRLALRAKLNVKGRDFPKSVDKAGRLLPARLRKQAAVIVKAQGLGGHPKLMRMVDISAVNRAHSEISDFLEGIDPRERRRNAVLRMAGGIAFNLLVVLTCFVIWLVWSGNL